MDFPTHKVRVGKVMLAENYDGQDAIDYRNGKPMEPSAYRLQRKLAQARERKDGSVTVELDVREAGHLYFRAGALGAGARDNVDPYDRTFFGTVMGEIRAADAMGVQLLNLFGQDIERLNWADTYTEEEKAECLLPREPRR